IVLALVLCQGLLGGSRREESLRQEDASLDIRVSVLNGCGAEGVADKISARLRDTGFDIVVTGNADAFDYEHTLVIDRCGTAEKARRVGDALDCDRVLTQRVNAPSSDVVVVIGSDWPGLEPFAR
ncbi:MAG: LytR C-terminal domain-containing protein, partial [Candidatus Eisenbacteria bacterium]